jgi:hypothetical protein
MPGLVSAEALCARQGTVPDDVILAEISLHLGLLHR